LAQGRKQNKTKKRRIKARKQKKDGWKESLRRLNARWRGRDVNKSRRTDLSVLFRRVLRFLWLGQNTHKGL
jgi:hypothetical protein